MAGESDKCRSGCNFDQRKGWAIVEGCPVHDPKPEPPVWCPLCRWDLRLASKDGGLFLDGAMRHMKDFHGLGDAAASAEVGKTRYL